MRRTALVESLGGAWPVIVAGALSAVAVFVVWGATLDAVPVMHDEWAYWTQADQYARLRWSTPSPPVPEFFEQFYVLVTPVFAAKYWPGHALAMAPGFALGAPALVPLFLTGVTGALLFALARRHAGVVVASLTWLLWLGAFGNLRFRAAYFSELTTSLCWLAAWWALLQWRATRRAKWMVGLAGLIGWGAISRPATMLVFAIPVGVVVLRDVVRERRWRDLAIGVATGSLVLAILPLWSARVAGDWRTTPLALYTRQYLPFDVPGYTVRTDQPERALPAEMERVRAFLLEVKRQQADEPAWRTSYQRLRLLLGDAFGGWRMPFALAFAAGLFTIGAIGWIALGSGLLLIAGYLSQAHTADWTVYYLEAMPALAYTAAHGARALLSRVAARTAGGARGIGEGPGIAISPALQLAGALAVATVLVLDVWRVRQTLDRIAGKPRAFRAGVARLPRQPNIVFVKYAERRSMHIALVANRGVLEGAASWIVHDRGDDNRRLLAAAPGRTAYLFDEATGEFREFVEGREGREDRRTPEVREHREARQ